VQLVGDRAARRRDDCIRSGTGPEAAVRNHSIAGNAVCSLSCRGRLSRHSDGRACRETRPALVDANTGGTDKSRSSWLGSSVVCNRRGRVLSSAEHMGHRHRQPLLAAARRLNQTHGRRMLAFAGAAKLERGAAIRIGMPAAKGKSVDMGALPFCNRAKTTHLNGHTARCRRRSPDYPVMVPPDRSETFC
jgi:hypothetical protein